MLYLIAQIWGPLLAAALCGAAAGWFWHAARLRPRQKALEEERRRLRAELLDLAIGLPAIKAADEGDEANLRRRITELERALAEARGRGAEADVLRRRLEDLGRGQARPVQAVDVTDYTTRIAALEVEIEAARRKVAEAEALQARLAGLQAQAPAPDLDLLEWRARYFAQRTSYLEDAARAAAEALAAAQARAAALEEKLAEPAAHDDEKEQLITRNRYMAERLKYLESEAEAHPRPDAETENRRRWRMRYLEQRLVHLESVHASAPAAGEVAQLHARIADLEQTHAESQAAADKLIEAEDEVIRARWTTRYLQARVNYLEDQAKAAMAAAAAREAQRESERKVEQEAEANRARAALEEAERRSRQAPAAITGEPAPPPQQVFRMERPAPLSAPRGGAPDDLTLIQGVTRQTESALRGLGVHHYDQIASWTPAHAAWINQYLNLAGRIDRENWIEQAGRLAAAVN